MFKFAFELLLSLQVISIFISSSGAQFQNFTCSNGEEISTLMFCDGRRDCADGSDEIYARRNTNVVGTNVSCSKGQRSCIIDIRQVCLQSVDCDRTDLCDIGCPNFYRCMNNNCTSRTTICDGNPCNGCDEDDDWVSGAGFQCIRNGERCKIPQQLLWDAIQDCDQGEDLCYTLPSSATNAYSGKDIRDSPLVSFDNLKCFECLDKSMIIPRQKVCDGVIDCSDLSDECLCEGNPPSICDDVTSRASALVYPGYLSQSQCGIGQISCGNGTCINRTSVCDSISNCPHNEDERFAYCRGTLMCENGLIQDQGQQCRCGSICDNVFGILCDGEAQCPPPATNGRWVQEPGYPADECQARCPSKPGFNCTVPFIVGYGNPLTVITCESRVPVKSSSPGPPPRATIETIEVESGRFCDGIADCTVNFEDEMNCTDRFYCQSNTRINIPLAEVCDGRVHCDDGSDESNVTCPDRFFCSSLNGAMISIDGGLVCDLIINCDNGEDEMNCTDDGRFYCESGNPLFVRERQIFDGNADCNDSSDECPTSSGNRNENVFSSRYELIANPILRGLVWVMGVLALVGNTAVIYVESRTLYRMREKRPSIPLKTNHTLILNLAVADLLMGIYLLMLGIAGGVYSGVFCVHSLEWRSGFVCQLMGVMVVLSSETSVITMMFLAGFRLLAVFKPFLAATQPKTRTLTIMIFLAWSISLLLALLPFTISLQYQFLDQAIIPNNPFFRSVLVSFESAKMWVERLLTFEPEFANATASLVNNIRGATTWGDLTSSLQVTNHTRLFQPSGYIGYYGIQSVCIPRLFVTREDNAWQFSIVIAIFNFLAFVFVATSYLIIIMKAQRASIKTQKSVAHHLKREKRTETMQRKIYRLVATDFFCWVPISVMVFIHFSGIMVSDIAYVISAIVLLPINSALNPILYSDAFDQVLNRLRVRKSLPPPNASSDTARKSTEIQNCVTTDTHI